LSCLCHFCFFLFIIHSFFGRRKDFNTHTPCSQISFPVKKEVFNQLAVPPLTFGSANLIINTYGNAHEVGNGIIVGGVTVTFSGIQDYALPNFPRNFHSILFLFKVNMLKSNFTANFLSKLLRSTNHTGSLRNLRESFASNGIDADFGTSRHHGRGQSRSMSSTPSSSPLTFKKGIILGIETSCDDTGIAIVNQNREVLGESINSQLQTHLKYN